MANIVNLLNIYLIYRVYMEKKKLIGPLFNQKSNV